MATTEEEIRAKLSLDTSVLAKAKRDISDFAEHGHSGFVHAESGGRAFHRMLERITESSPLMGNALKFAISPIPAMMGLAAGAFAFATQAIEKFNESLDRMGAKNAKALIDIRAINEALFKRSEQSQEQRLNFEQAQRGHQPPIIEEIKAANPGINDIALRTLLIQRRRQLFGLGVGQMGELDVAQANFDNPRLAGALEKAKQIREKTVSRLKEIEPERSKALSEEAGEASSWMDRPNFWMNFIPFGIGRRMQNTLNMPREMEREGLTREFYKLTEQLKKQDDLIREMEKIEKDSTKTVKEKQDAIDKINKDIRDIDAALRNMPGFPVPAAAPRPMGPTIDPTTGGYTYQPIQDLGGIPYKPLPGSIGYVPPGMQPKKMTAETVTEMLKMFLTGANTEGVKIIVKDVAVEK